MTHKRHFHATLIFCLIALPSLTAAQTATPSPAQVARSLGFTDQEIRQIEGGQVINKSLNEGSDKELAGVVAVFFRKPLDQLLDLAMQGKLLEKEKNILAFQVWKPGDSPDDAFARAAFDTTELAEARSFTKASRGDHLNLSNAEIARFRKVRDNLNGVNAALRAALMDRYLAYLQHGLSGIPSYARNHGEASPAAELSLAIRETLPASPRRDFFDALLAYPTNQPPSVEHRFYWFKQKVEDRPTFVLAHRAQRHNDAAAVMTETQFYVGHSYNSNFMASGGFTVQGGTLVFYINRTFTDQVAGFASGARHGIGRGQMLSEVTANLQRVQADSQR
jgi:hypothetical protein